ncbi:Reverse transcriptase domain-containing protein [Caenorhabditis elegans]|uniref:Reverse transcriptase domain-containing protein n=1 Tax=Caenorhabditis elegans TaxID=6239 RepID=A0A486WWY1_CAEEL|nr:Reverse transcriptase domain-containing protein [Caenorhabditis elegans]VGM69509.1 Reverse transcriptase domain-containing protein [Caenorhabditis elegans]
MSSEGSIVPIKLAQRFIHVIDFHADPVTCISASSGTVSYDSVTSPKYPQNDAILCGQQPPPPPHKSTIKTVFKKELMEIPIPVDIEMFRAIQKQYPNAYQLVFWRSWDTLSMVTNNAKSRPKCASIHHKICNSRGF